MIGIPSITAIEKFRDRTRNQANSINLHIRTQQCPGCKKSRSPTQFEGKKTCKTCRGVK